MRQEIKEQLKGTSLARGMTDDDVEALLASSQVRTTRRARSSFTRVMCLSAFFCSSQVLCVY